MTRQTQTDDTDVPNDPPEKVEGIQLLPKPTRERLNGMQREDYKQHRYKLVRWLLDKGKNPKKETGYKSSTARGRALRIDLFYRYVWDQEGRYTTQVTHDHADEYVKHLSRDQDTTKNDRSNKQNAVITLFKWRSEVFGNDEWEPDDEWREHGGGNSDQKDQPHFTDRERGLLRDAVLDFRSVPHYNTLEPDERDEMKAYLSQRLEKPKDDIAPDDFQSVPTRKYASLVQTTLDTGLRPSEVAEFRVSWFDPDNTRIIIPEKHSQKNTNRWVCSLRQRTSTVLSQWVDERATRAKYDDSERMWLTKYGNPYGSGSLNRLLEDLCEHAGISKRDRTWYSIRRSTANVVGTNASAEHARKQMRHKQVETTMRYIQPDEEKTREALNQGG